MARRLLPWVCVLTALSCTGPDPVDKDAPADSELVAPTSERTWLSEEAQLTRISMALRGVRPAPEDYRAVADDPAAREALLDSWLQDPRFAATVRHLYAELFRLRTDSLQFPPLGPLLPETRQDIGAAVSEEPLALIEHVLTEDRPFTEIVTADYTVLDRIGAQMWRGHDYDLDGPEVQVVHFTDGRPTAGVLSTHGLWARHVSAGGNHHRGRANLIADALLCEDFFRIGVDITASLDLSDEEAVADAVRDHPACVACHADLDPMAAHLWTVAPEVTPGGVAVSYLLGCNAPNLLNFCYPIDMYTPELRAAWLLLGLRGPGFYGTASDDLQSLGQAIADDPRFARCTARRFYAYFHQAVPEHIPVSALEDLTQTFVDSGYNAKALARAVVQHPDFLAASTEDPLDAALTAGALTLRPLQQAQLIEDLTGFRYLLDVDGLGCDLLDLDCYGAVDVHHDDRYGVRSMTGGMDGVRVTRPTYLPTPTKLLHQHALSEEAAGFVVRADLAEPDPSRRHLLHLVQADTSDEALLREQLAFLHQRILAESVAPDSPEVDASFELFDTLARARGTQRAWRGVIAAFLQSPSVLFY